MELDRAQLLKPVRKLRKLVAKMDRQPVPAKVHRLRTNTRRFEAMFEALSLDSQGGGKSTLRDLGRIRKSAGKVRDMDVFTSFASEIHLKGEEDCLVQLLEHLGARRQKEAKKLHGKIKRVRPALLKNLKRTPAILAKLIRQNGKASKGSGIAADAGAAAVKLAAELATPVRLSRNNLHSYRIKVKELRNVLLMTAGASQKKFVQDLGELKDAIGEWHDREELVSIARKALDHGNRCALTAELKRLAKSKYQRALALAHTLRKRYPANSRPA